MRLFFVSEVHGAPEHSQDETLVISISPDVFRGRRERRGKRFNTKPKRFSQFIKKNPEPKITASFLVFTTDVYITMTTAG